jgi:biopolymer transport protein TolQ
VQDPQSLSQSLMQRLGESWVVLLVLLLLVFLSLGSWFIIGFKWLYFRRLRTQSALFLDAFWQSKRLDAVYQRAEQLDSAPVSRVFKAGYQELDRVKRAQEKRDPGAQATMEAKAHIGGIENVERALRRAMLAETTNVEKMVPFLATTGSAAPFIGLFGTVWGIMEAFASIDPSKSLLTSVAPHIAEALIATAVGLAAAIPAVMAYNYFVQKIKVTAIEMDNFSSDFLNIVRRHFF